MDEREWLTERLQQHRSHLCAVATGCSGPSAKPTMRCRSARRLSGFVAFGGLGRNPPTDFRGRAEFELDCGKTATELAKNVTRFGAAALDGASCVIRNQTTSASAGHRRKCSRLTPTADAVGENSEQAASDGPASARAA